MTRVTFILTWWLLAVFFTEAAEVGAPTADQPVNLGKCYGAFHSNSYLEVAAALQAMPESKRVAQLRAWASVPNQNRPTEIFGGENFEQIMVLCHMLFVAPVGQAFPEPSGVHWNLLGKSPVPGGAPAAPEWPAMPVALVDGVPFFIACGWGNEHISRPGEPSTALQFVEYCVKNLTWTSQHYQPADEQTLHKVLAELLASPAWKNPLNLDAKNFLSLQIEPYQPPAATADDMDYDGFSQSLANLRPILPDLDAINQAKQAALRDPAAAAAMQKFKESLRTADEVMRATLGKDRATQRLLDRYYALELVTGLNDNVPFPPLGLDYRVEPSHPPPEPDGSAPKRPDQLTAQEIMNRSLEINDLKHARDQALKDPAVAAAILKAREAYHQANVALLATLSRDPAIKALLEKYPYLKLARIDLGFGGSGGG
jgi:hypothetical protein